MAEGYPQKDLDDFKAKLLKLRVRVVENVEGIEKGVHDLDEQSHVTFNHLADAGSDTSEEDVSLGQLENEENLLVRIDEALARIEDKSFGICMKTGKRIPKARLNALPFAEYTVEAQEEIEKEEAGA